MTSRESTSFWPVTDHGNVPPMLWRERAMVGLFAPLQAPWLLKSLYGGTPASKAALLARLDLPGDALPHLGSWKADTGLLHHLVDRIERDRPAQVAEFGCGASSLIIGRALERNGGGRLTSYENDAGFAAATRGWLDEHRVAHDIRIAPLRRSDADDWPGPFYAPGDVPERIDLMLIDGPVWTLHPLVRGAAERYFERIAPGGTILLDDAARPGERVIARRWRRRWPDIDFQLEHFGSKGTLVATRTASRS